MKKILLIPISAIIILTFFVIGCGTSEETLNPQITRFEVFPKVIMKGDSAQLQWKIINFSKEHNLTISNAGLFSAYDSTKVIYPDKTSTYKLDVLEDGKVLNSKTVTLTVIDKPTLQLQDDGRFNIGACEKSLIYGYPEQYSTSHFIVNIDGFFASNNPSLVNQGSEYLKFVKSESNNMSKSYYELIYYFRDVKIIQKIVPYDKNFVERNEYENSNFLRISYEFVNQSKQQKSINLAVLMDYKIDRNDNPIIEANYIPITRQTKYDGASVPDEILSYSNQDEKNTFSSLLILKKYSSDKPDEVIIGDWLKLSKSLWETDETTSNINDGAVLLKWIIGNIKPNDKQKISYYFGSPNCPVSLIFADPTYRPEGYREISGEGHFGKINSISLFKTKKIILSGGDDGVIKLWEASTGKLLYKITASSQPINSITCYNDKDKSDELLVASAGLENTIKIWKLTFSGNVIKNQLLLNLYGHEKPINLIKFSKDGNILVSGGSDGLLKIWDIYTGRLLKTIIAHVGTIISFDISEPFVYEPIHSNIIPNIIVYNQIVSPKIISSGSDRKVKMWDLQTGECLLDTVNKDIITSILFINKGLEYLAGDEKGIIDLIETRTGFQKYTLHKHTGAITAMDATTNGQLMASCGTDLVISFWDLENGKWMNSFNKHIDRINSAGFLDDEGVFVSSGYDNVINIMNLNNLEQMSRIENCHNIVVNKFLFTSSGSELLSVAEDGNISYWDFNRSKERLDLTFSIKSSANCLTALAISPVDNLFATGSSDGLIFIWDYIKKIQLYKFPKLHTDYITSLAFSPDGKKIASASKDNTIRIWNIPEIRDLQNPITLEGHSNGVTSIAFDPSGKKIASGSLDGTIKVWDIETKSIYRILKGHSFGVTSIAFSTTGDSIFSAGVDKTIRIWDIEKELMLEKNELHKDIINSIAVAPKSPVIVSCSMDGTIRIWNYKYNFYLNPPLNFSNGIPISVSIDSNGENIAVCGSGEINLKIITDYLPIFKKQ